MKYSVIKTDEENVYSARISKEDNYIKNVLLCEI